MYSIGFVCPIQQILDAFYTILTFHFKYQILCTCKLASSSCRNSTEASFQLIPLFKFKLKVKKLIFFLLKKFPNLHPKASITEHFLFSHLKCTKSENDKKAHSFDAVANISDFLWKQIPFLVQKGNIWKYLSAPFTN